ncbi:hypothetical protein GPECTOR_76g795 [Gonium pectorale]|uniref:Peptidase M11 gametolysin domain-containing protein n=1 Tax=Gonium pectorale TaxID=33097 RepID=A0A150G2D1_GONPE|nr:hypothetical protein GPECTOR_76g795 [Gonium pectorale]|eukprot:KXZ43974.1 hypothetical protein GPECTOR_76g795 [Gonium pectorale]
MDNMPTRLVINASTASKLTPLAGSRIRVRRAGSITPPSPGYRRLLRGEEAPSKPTEEGGFEVDTIQVLEQPGPKDIKIGAMNITSVVFLLSFCNYNASVDLPTFRRVWLNNDSSPASAYTMQNYWSNCSQGLARMTSTQQIVIEAPEIYAWMNLAEDHARFNLGLNISHIKQRVAILPRQVDTFCPWAGLASIGCGGTRCYTWINGGSATNLPVIFHEMGHNLGLMHSNRNGSADDYGDYTCAMGSAPSCYNSVQTWKLGWTRSLLPGGSDLNSTALSVGTTLAFQLPFQTRSFESVIRVYPDWAAPAGSSSNLAALPVPAFYISLRNRALPFENLATSLFPSPRVLIHTSNITQNVSSFQRPTLQTLVAPGRNFSAPLPFGLVVRVLNISNTTGASVTICRAERAAESPNDESCFDGIDNDCDGLLLPSHPKYEGLAYVADALPDQAPDTVFPPVSGTPVPLSAVPAFSVATGLMA